MKIDPFRPGDPAEYWQMDDLPEQDDRFGWWVPLCSFLLGAALMVSALGWREWL